MCDILCVTNRALCEEDFLTRLARVAKARPAAILLREKDLSPAEYAALAGEVLALCRRYGVPLILHTFWREALELGHPAVHLPLPVLRGLTARERGSFSVLGASCHSAEEAREAQALGCTYLTAGHVFPTACKPGLPPRGLPFLEEVCSAVSIPVWAIGGVTPARMPAVRAAGAAGGCIMGAFMTCREPGDLLAPPPRPAP